jgi:hypothetical protein
MDGTPFAGDLAEMTGSEHLVYQAVRYDETGTVLADLEFAVWTATNPNGTQEGTTCSDWSSTTGSAYTGVGTYVGRDWTEYVSLGCADDEIRLSCFETGDGDPLDWPREPGALAFLTTVKGSGKLSTWADAGGESGIDAGDEVCRARAEAAFLPLPESFVAWLSDGAEDAKDRVTVDGPFVRVDGFLFAASEAAMLGNDADIRTGLNVTELETYYVQPHLGGNVWTGTFYAGEVALEHCLDWESELDTEGGNSGNSAAARFDWHHNGVPFCHVARPIYCFSNVELLAWDNFERGDLHRWTSDSSGP